MIHAELTDNFVVKKQKGFYDDIICTNCELQTQIYDRYVSLALSDNTNNSPEYLSIKRSPREKIIQGEKHTYSHWTNIDFLKFQKFVFACVLRTDLSLKKQGKFLLVNRHYYRLRDIYNSNELDDISYPIMVIKYLNTDDIRNIMYLPFVNKKQGHHIIDFSGAGYVFWLFVSNHPKSHDVMSTRLTKEGSLFLLHTDIKSSGTFKSALPSLVSLALNYPDVLRNDRYD